MVPNHQPQANYTSVDDFEVGKAYEWLAASQLLPVIASFYGVDQLEVTFDLSTVRSGQPVDVVYYHNGSRLATLEVKARPESRGTVQISPYDQKQVVKYGSWLVFLTRDKFYLGSPQVAGAVSNIPVTTHNQDNGSSYELHHVDLEELIKFGFEEHEFDNRTMRQWARPSKRCN